MDINKHKIAAYYLASDILKLISSTDHFKNNVIKKIKIIDSRSRSKELNYDDFKRHFDVNKIFEIFNEIAGEIRKKAEELDSKYNSFDKSLIDIIDKNGDHKVN